ncbi:MAG: V-type ATP synthase subunit F [Ruminococcaceae bacterium]|nr:V-type ATP synthase subunit F [Oscillospiraceae bacterium]
MYKIAIIGDRDSVLGFMALGFATYEAENAERAAKILHTIARDESYAVIFIVEDLAQNMVYDILKYKDDPLPAIVSIPGRAGANGFGMNSIKSAVERAVGADIIFK